MIFLIENMSKDGEYYIPEKLEDEFLRSLAANVKNVLKDNDILEDILQKYIIAYNKTLKERCSAKSLQVMNQNHKPIFSTITSSGVIKSPRVSSVSAEKDTKVPRISSQLKTNRISSNTERKRLSFDVEENECIKPFMENSKECQMMVTSPNKETSVSVTADERTVKSFSATQSLFSSKEEANPYDGREESFNLVGNSESSTSLPVYYEANLSANIPNEDENMVVTTELTNGSTVNCINGDTRSAWYLESRQSFYRYDIAPENSNSQDMFRQQRFNFEGKPETLTSLDIYENEYMSPESPDNHQMMVTSPEKKNSTLLNFAIDDRKSATSLTISSSLSSKEKTEVSDDHNTNEKKSFNEKLKIVSRLPVDHLETSSIFYKTPDKIQTMAVNANVEEQKNVNQVVKIDPNQEFFTPKKEDKSSNNTKMNKRKSVDYSQENKIDNSLVAEDQEFVPPKMPKIDVITMDSKKAAVSVVDGHASFNPTLVDDSKFSHFADNFATDDIDSFNRPNDNFMDEREVSRPDDKSEVNKTTTLSNHKDDKCEIMPVISDKLSEKTASTTKDCASYFSPVDEQKKLAIEVKSHIGNFNNDQTKARSTHDAKDVVESLTNLMENLSPSVKRYSDGTIHKSITNGSVSDETTFVKQLHLRENLSKTATSAREGLISNLPSLKPDNIYALQGVKFIETLNQRKTRLTMYLHLFVEDQHDLWFISAYIKKLAAIIKKTPVNENKEVLREAVMDFLAKGIKLLNKTTSWEVDIEKDIDVWEDCIQKVKQMELGIKRFCREKKLTPKNFQQWEEIFRIVNKKADDMTLLRDVRRPTILQFGYELENLIQLFIRCMLEVGLLKHSTRVC